MASQRAEVDVITASALFFVYVVDVAIIISLLIIAWLFSLFDMSV